MKSGPSDSVGVRVRVDLPRVLRQARKACGFTQRELGDALGISQSYVSKLESGERELHDLILLRRLAAVLHLDPSEVGIAQEWLFDGGEADAIYERALLALGGADFVNAEVMLRRLIHGGRGLVTSPTLRARAQRWLAGILRDRFELDGPDGAIALYERALEHFTMIGAHAEAREVSFLLGACDEMLGQWDAAMARYATVVERGEATGSPQAVARAMTRIGTIQTKATATDTAETTLHNARKIAVHLDESFPYGFATEKTALLELRKGRFMEAHDLATVARSETNMADPIRVVQSHLVTADIALSAGDRREGLTDLLHARTLALEHDFRHQLKAVEHLIKQVKDEIEVIE